MTALAADPTRRRLLLVAPAALVALALPACEKKEPDSCSSTLGLTNDEIKTRTSLAYKDRGPDPNKLCLGCEQYLPPPKADECGSCKVLKGPVHSKGTCNVFTPKR
jgi:hypothetical protein